MKCKSCGVDKKLHSADLWKMHQQMHEAYKKLLKQYHK